MAGVLVHEWIAATGGSEKVLDSLARMFPLADLQCLWTDVPDRFPGRNVHQTWLAATPLRRSKLAALPFMPGTWSALPAVKAYDWMLVSSHLFAHHARFTGPARHAVKLSYIHSPARYIWAPEQDSRGSAPVLKAAASLLKPLDRRRSRESVALAANSAFIRDRIRRVWDLDAEVIHPPVDVGRIQAVPDWAHRLGGRDADLLAALPAEFVLGASRFIGYKDLHRVIEVGARMQLPVVLAGSGPLGARLREDAHRAGVPVHFPGTVSDELLFALYQRCRLFVFPPVEDFGIMPVEAMAAGARVLANRVGGTAETVVDGATGALTDFTRPDELEEAISRANSGSAEAARLRAASYSEEIFQSRILAWTARYAGISADSGGAT
ncbi:glycosyltransferase [Arthrobacter sulfonylureivorans]|uniref:Glycosyltransferase n=1 Tax=Arthrobacter sulfonylureivorans TaxID=2486855 RepID=A0ABY3W699_9MICC|nr:glycosyltransferase [Arthrobacter sulfonylureivorans]UNK45807.1 glycosyltransferase [Arthrobacter sulfonylureivorans]